MGLHQFPRDIKEASGKASVRGCVLWAICNHTAHLVLMFRFGQSIRRLPILGGPLGLIVEYLMRIIFASDISCKAQVGSGFVIQHGHDIVIGADVRVGSSCKIFNGVTLGNRDVSKSSFGSQPTLGDRVTIGTGAKILGPLQIGSDVTIGANAVVIRSFPSGVVLAGVPASIVKAQG